MKDFIDKIASNPLLWAICSIGWLISTYGIEILILKLFDFIKRKRK